MLFSDGATTANVGAAHQDATTVGVTIVGAVLQSATTANVGAARRDATTVGVTAVLQSATTAIVGAGPQEPTAGGVARWRGAAGHRWRYRG